MGANPSLETVTPSPIELNARDLEKELAWFARLLDTRFKLYFSQETSYTSVFEVAPPEFGSPESAYAGFLRHYAFSFAERVALV
ncbi:MAG TPA: ATP-binding protein, partial [Accumulibacter sp.]|nr:ATP-binding protein [Accumulibacter sp.]